jgi:histone-lysine N-methyltransferase SETMAR
MYMQYFTHDNCYGSQYLSSKCLLYPHQELGELKVCAKWIPHVLNDDQRAMQVFLTIIHLQHWRNEDNAFLDHILTVDESWMHPFDPQLKWQNAEWRAQMSLKWQNAEWNAQMSMRKKTASCSQGVLSVVHIRFFSRNGLVFDHPAPVGSTVSGWYYCSLLRDKVRPALRCKQLELLENGVISLRDNATSHHHRDMQNPVQCCGREVLAYPPYSPDLAPCDYWLFTCVTELLWGKGFESENNINTAVTVSLQCPNKDDYRAVNDRVLCSGKSVWTVLVLTQSRGHVMCVNIKVYE